MIITPLLQQAIIVIALLIALLIASGESKNKGKPVPMPWPTVKPTVMPRTVPTPVKSPVAVQMPSTSSNSATALSTTFYAIADLPYSTAQAVKLLDQMQKLPKDAEFVIHLGDLRLARNSRKCKQSEYEYAATRLQASHVPVFVVVGDNDWTDCPNQEEGWSLWNETFVGFESKHWTHPFNIQRQSGRPENFSFVHKGSLFIGLNIVGGSPTDANEWKLRLKQQLDWVKILVRNYEAQTPGVGRIVMFGHADPNSHHNLYFFNDLTTFIKVELNNTIPVAYLNGDKHVWSYNENWYQQKSWLRVMISGNAIAPPTKVTINANGEYQAPSQAFQFDRRL